MDPIAPVIEIIERGSSTPGSDSNKFGVIVPNDVRINGQSLLVSDEPITVHEVGLDAGDVVRVTVTFLARRVFIGHESEAGG